MTDQYEVVRRWATHSGAAYCVCFRGLHDECLAKAKSLREAEFYPWSSYTVRTLSADPVGDTFAVAA